MVKVKLKKQTVYYWDIVFKNFDDEEVLYCCVAPNYVRAINSFMKYIGTAPFTFISCTTDGVGYALH